MNEAKKIADLRPGHNIQCEDSGFVYRLEDSVIHAVSAALASGRPLLVRGEPGVGKSQLSRAVAIELGYRYYTFVTNSRTEAQDLLWTTDLVMRLADAQSMGAIANVSNSNRDELRQEIALGNYILPGPLWWAFDWEYASAQLAKSTNRESLGGTRKSKKSSVVLLIDEIDKAETDVPNGLLESLGSGEFQPGGGLPLVKVDPKTPPLIVITTNEERILPDPFVRRCFVLHLFLPNEKQKFVETLVQRGKDHFPKVSKEVLTVAANQLYDDRNEAKDQGLKPLPGQAEYLDLLKALVNLGENRIEQLDLLERLSRFAFRKNASADGLF